MIKNFLNKNKKRVEVLQLKPTIKGKPVGEDVKPNTEIPKMFQGGGVYIVGGQKNIQVKLQKSRTT